MITETALRLAHDQFGVVSGDQLRELGYSLAKISRARRSGILVDVAPGVVRIASSPLSFGMRCMSAQLAVREAGFLSAWTAARLFGLRSMPSSPIHLTLPPTRRPRLPTWIEEHRSEWFDEDDRTLLPNGLVVATPLRMLFGLAAHFNQFRFERAAEDAWHRELVSPAAADDYLQRHRCRGKDGVATMERWLQRALHQPRPAQSGLERDLLHEIERIGLPVPVRQYPLELAAGETVHIDIAWPDVRLGVEPGHSWWHGGDRGQRRDQARDRGCSELGWLIVRFDETMRSDLHAAAAQVARIHADRARMIRNSERS